MKYLYILILVTITLITSCNPVGEKIDTIICEETYINSSIPFDLKKGDKIGIWLAASGVRPDDKDGDDEEKEDTETEKTDNIAIIGINIQLKDQSVYFEKVRVLPVRPMINTSYDKKRDYLKEYETLAHTYTATESGAYSVDTKLYNAPFGQDVSVVVRKK